MIKPYKIIAPKIWVTDQAPIFYGGKFIRIKPRLECNYYKNLSWDEIASSLGYANAASARNQKYKCLERIRKIVNVEIE